MQKPISLVKLLLDAWRFSRLTRLDFIKAGLVFGIVDLIAFIALALLFTIPLPKPFKIALLIVVPSYFYLASHCGYCLLGLNWVLRKNQPKFKVWRCFQSEFVKIAWHWLLRTAINFLPWVMLLLLIYYSPWYLFYPAQRWVSLGLIMAVISYLWVAYTLTLPLILEQNLMPGTALKLSKKLLTPHWFKVAIILVISYLSYWIIPMIFLLINTWLKVKGIYDPSWQHYLILSLLIIQVVWIVAFVRPWLECMQALLYQRVVRDLGNAQ